MSIQVNDHGKYRVACIGCYGKCSKTSNTFPFLLANKMLVFRAGSHIKCLSEKQTGKAQIRLLLKKQSDLGLHCLSRPFCSQLEFKIL